MLRNRWCALAAATLACAIGLEPAPAAGYQTADLAGLWEFNSLASGPAAPWWERSRVVVASDGSFLALSNTSAGEVDTLGATFAVSPAGIVTLLESATFSGALDPGTTVLVGTDTWSGGSPGTTELKLGLRQAGGASVTDLAGEWEINAIASGPGAPWWLRGRIAVAANGDFSGTLTDNEGRIDPAAGSFGMSVDGVVTFSESGAARGVVDAGRSVLAMTNTWSGSEAGTTELAIGVRMAASYAITDLAGTWELHGLATGPGAPWWSRARITVAANGSFTGSGIESDGGGGPISGNFTIAPDGVVLRTGAGTARGVLDAGKSVMVWTSVWDTGSPGTTELMVGIRTVGATAAAGGAPALAFALDPVRPNPASGRIPAVSFSLPGGAAARLELLDAGGRRIAGREVGGMGPGRHQATLAEGRPLAPGLYWVSLRQGNQVSVRRVVVL